MVASIGNDPARIFMSYRREDTAYPAGWLFDRLADRFGRDQVFKDDGSIELGDDFVEVITTAVGSCDVLLALIGGEWLTVTGPDGQRRLDDPDDFVRLEIEAALTRNVRVIPILVGGARMPRADELPASLAKLARRHALELSPARFDADTQHLLRALDRTIAEAQEQARREAERTPVQQQRQVERIQGRHRERVAQDGDVFATASDELPAPNPAAADPDGLAGSSGDAAAALASQENLAPPIISAGAVGTSGGKRLWWKLQPSEAKKLGASAGILGTFSAVTSLVGLYTHNPTAVLAWPAVLMVIAVLAFVAVNRGFKIKVGLSLPVLIGLLFVATLGGAVLGGTVGHVLRTAGPVGNQSSAPPSPSSSSGSTPSSSPRPPDKVIFSDTFCTTVGDWTTGGGRTGGHYSRCALRVYANADDVESSEPRAHAVYPATPAGVEIDVTAHRVAGSAEGDEYGVACRADGMGYAFIVQSDLAEIIRYSSTTGIIGPPLSDVPAKVDMNARNRLQVTCANSGAGVYLALRVNGQQLTETVDTNNPISSGTVGLFAATTPATQTPTEAEFENFKVTSLSGAATASTSPVAAPQGVITDPPAGATDVYYHEQLHVSGTAQNIPSGYHLDVFLQFAGDQRYYAAADPNIAAPLTNGHWSATIFIGEAKPIILWLVSLSPAEVNLMNSDVPDHTAGYPALPGTRLASVSFTAKASP